MRLPDDEQPTRVMNVSFAENTVVRNLPRDETVVMAAAGPKKVPREGAAFVPSEGRTKDSDDTALWRPERGSAARELLSGLHRIPLRLNRRQMAAIGGVLFAIGLVFIFTGPKASAMVEKSDDAHRPPAGAPSDSTTDAPLFEQTAGRSGSGALA